MGGKNDITVKARQALIPLWEECHKLGMRGRPWGIKSPTNLLGGTNTVLAIGDELVSVSEKDGRLVIHEFRRKSGTQLGDKVRKILREAELLD